MKKSIVLFPLFFLFFSNNLFSFWGFSWLSGESKKSLEETYWDANKTKFNQALDKFKNAPTDNDKAEILQQIMSDSSSEYEQQISGLEKKIDELKGNYRKTMSFVVKKFEEAAPNSTIIYLPDNKLVTIFNKDASDDEKSQLMYNLLLKARDIKKQNMAKQSIKDPFSTATIQNYGQSTQSSTNLNPQQALAKELSNLKNQLLSLREEQQNLLTQNEINKLKNEIAQAKSLLTTKQPEVDLLKKEQEKLEVLRKIQAEIQTRKKSNQSTQEFTALDQEIAKAKQQLDALTPQEQQPFQTNFSELQNLWNQTKQETDPETQKLLEEILEIEKGLERNIQLLKNSSIQEIPKL